MVPSDANVISIASGILSGRFTGAGKTPTQLSGDIISQYRLTPCCIVYACADNPADHIENVDAIDLSPPFDHDTFVAALSSRVGRCVTSGQVVQLSFGSACAEVHFHADGTTEIPCQPVILIGPFTRTEDQVTLLTLIEQCLGCAIYDVAGQRHMQSGTRPASSEAKE
jgi:hypothetical protein